MTGHWSLVIFQIPPISSPPPFPAFLPPATLPASQPETALISTCGASELRLESVYAPVHRPPLPHRQLARHSAPLGGVRTDAGGVFRLGDGPDHCPVNASAGRALRRRWRA